jgi:hypothetical protein
MHAVVVKVTVNDPEAGVTELNQGVIPRVKQAPGFVSGTWVGKPGTSEGMSVAVFETEEAARAMAAMIESPPEGQVTIDSVEVWTVVGSA